MTEVETQTVKLRNKQITQACHTNMSLPELCTKLIEVGQCFQAVTGTGTELQATHKIIFGKNHPKYKPIVCLCVIEEKHITIDFQDVLLKVKY